MAVDGSLTRSRGELESSASFANACLACIRGFHEYRPKAARSGEFFLPCIVLRAIRLARTRLCGFKVDVTWFPPCPWWLMGGVNSSVDVMCVCRVTFVEKCKMRQESEINPLVF